MPRSLRIEYPGAVYHVLNRGNYRDSVFFSDTVKEIFENTLFVAWKSELINLFQNRPFRCTAKVRILDER